MVRARPNAPPEPANIPVADLRSLADLRTPWCLRVVATLGIADRVAAGITDVRDLAAAVECDGHVLHSVLGELVAKGVFEEYEPGKFALNEAARGLLSPNDFSLEGIGGRFAHAWSTLLTYVQTGRSAYHEVFGRSFWEDLDAHPEIAADFDALMGPAGHGTPNPDFEMTVGWDSIRTVVDVGGGTGAMLAEVLKAHPHLRGMLVDLPRTVARSGDIFAAAGVSDRVEVVGQSFFDPLPSGADLYLLKGVLNDWPDRETVAILRRCAEAAGRRGRLVVLGGVAPDGAPKRLGIDMVVTGGRTNSLSEFRELAREAGLEVKAAGHQGSGYYAVECAPL
jgi:2,7-dihydroxy-5-methyl-1-naphthoate 7-O-methyltransferase